MTVPTFAEAVAEDLEDVFFDTDELAETVTYERDGISAGLAAVFREVTMDDMVSEHVTADAVICFVREVDLHDFFDREPERGDTITRSLTPALGQGLREEVWTVCGAPDAPVRAPDGTWRLVCEKGTRLHP